MDKRISDNPIKFVLFLAYGFCLIFITNPLSKFWTFFSYHFRFYKLIDYPTHEFSPDLLPITYYCIVHPWENKAKLTVYDCRDNNSPLKKPIHLKTEKELTIAIASFHHYENNIENNNKLTRYEKLILTNHIAYTIKHKYIYFDCNDLIFDNQHIKNYFNETLPSTNAIYKAQKPFIINKILNDKYYGNKIDYVLWIDFDAIFFNCTTSIKSIIDYTHNLYSHSIYYNTMDIIFSRDYFSIANSGVIIYKNTAIVKNILLKQMYVFENADKFRFDDIYYNIHRLIDQNVFNALVLGFDPQLNNSKYLLNDNGYFELNKILKYEKEIHKLIPHWHSWSKCLDDEKQYVYIHDNYIGLNIRNHSAMIPQFYLNLIVGEWIYARYYKGNKFKYDPIIFHFSSAHRQVYLSSPKFKKLKCSVKNFAF